MDTIANVKLIIETKIWSINLLLSIFRLIPNNILSNIFYITLFNVPDSKTGLEILLKWNWYFMFHLYFIIYSMNNIYAHF